jgi:hypothetical protein
MQLLRHGFLADLNRVGVLPIERIEGGDGFFKARFLFKLHAGNMQSLELAASPRLH